MKFEKQLIFTYILLTNKFRFEDRFGQICLIKFIYNFYSSLVSLNEI